jgi:class 3 adenylate cyclase
MPPEGEDGGAEVWEQKPGAVLAIDVAWADSMELHALPAEPWTVATRWQQTIAEKVQGFGGLLVQHAPSPLTAVFGLPQTLEQLPQRAVQAALAIRHQLAEDRAQDSRQSDSAVQMALHLGQVLVDVQAHDPTARLLPLGETLSLPVRLLGQAAPDDILLSPPVGRLVEGWFELRPREDQRGPASLTASAPMPSWGWGRDPHRWRCTGSAPSVASWAGSGNSQHCATPWCWSTRAAGR